MGLCVLHTMLDQAYTTHPFMKCLSHMTAISFFCNHARPSSGHKPVKLETKRDWIRSKNSLGKIELSPEVYRPGCCGLPCPVHNMPLQESGAWELIKVLLPLGCLCPKPGF